MDNKEKNIVVSENEEAKDFERDKITENPASAEPTAEDTAIENPTVADSAADAPKTDLGDVSRVKVISPGRLVVKRFMRNRLAIVGACILIFMFIFAFLGPVFSPYGEAQTFVKYEGTRTAYVSGTFDTTATYYGDTSDNLTGTQIARLSELMKDMAVGDEVQETIGGADIKLKKTDDNICSVAATRKNTVNVATYSPATKEVKLESAYENVEGLADAITAYMNEHKSDGTFVHNGVTYSVKRERLTFKITTTTEYEFGGMLSTYFVYFNELLDSESAEEIKPDFSHNSDTELKSSLIKSIAGGAFEYDGATYTAEHTAGGDIIFSDGDRTFAFVSAVRVVSALGTDEVFMSVVMDYVAALRHMAQENIDTYSYKGDVIVMNDSTQAFELSEDAGIDITLDRGVYSSKADMTRMLLDLNASPSKEHWLGTDGNGMDNLTRMMYGGRVSLMVGFIVIIIEVLIGIVMGGIAGYFGGWVDMLIMRIVDIFNCIPFMPVMIILGAVFDSLMLNPWLRIIYIMMIMGLVSWTGVARLVRGQILSLREQEFMQAAEATGISVPRRIFKHLVPNVMPQLIVSATMGLGDVIITESTLSFLGLGCKYPMSSWGTIINSVNTKFGLLNYTYVWIPVGLLISLTVIAFNFIGDGLRDAFDPKMKR